MEEESKETKNRVNYPKIFSEVMVVPEEISFLDPSKISTYLLNNPETFIPYVYEEILKGEDEKLLKVLGYNTGLMRNTPLSPYIQYMFEETRDEDLCRDFLMRYLVIKRKAQLGMAYDEELSRGDLLLVRVQIEIQMFLATTMIANNKGA